MSSKPKAFLDLYTSEVNNFTIYDLISHLQWTFLSDDYELVADLLSVREAKAKRDYALLEEKHAALWSWSLRMEEELKSCREENGELRVEMARSKHEHDSSIVEPREQTERDRRATEAMVAVEDELKSCKKENAELKQEMSRAREEYEKGSVELRGKVKRMEREGRRANTLVQLYQSRFDMLMTRVIRLEDDAKVFLMPDDQPRETGETACASKESKKDVSSISKTESGMLQYNGKASASKLKRKGVSSFGGVDDDGRKSCRRSPGGETEPPQYSSIKLEEVCFPQCPTESIILSKSNVETSGTSQKQNSGALRSHEGKIMSAELTNDRLLSQTIKFSRVDSSSGDNWNTETDMIEALEKDAQLSMKAICALYREKAFKVSERPNTPSHEKSVAQRGTSLGEFLINGDPRAKLKKTVLELQEEDEKGVQDCKRIAKVYSKTLFEIYEKEKGNYLPPFF